MMLYSFLFHHRKYHQSIILFRKLIPALSDNNVLRGYLGIGFYLLKDQITHYQIFLDVGELLFQNKTLNVVKFMCSLLYYKFPIS